ERCFYVDTLRGDACQFFSSDWIDERFARAAAFLPLTGNIVRQLHLHSSAKVRRRFESWHSSKLVRNPGMFECEVGKCYRRTSIIVHIPEHTLRCRGQQPIFFYSVSPLLTISYNMGS